MASDWSEVVTPASDWSSSFQGPILMRQGSINALLNIALNSIQGRRGDEEEIYFSIYLYRKVQTVELLDMS